MGRRGGGQRALAQPTLGTQACGLKRAGLWGAPRAASLGAAGLRLFHCLRPPPGWVRKGPPAQTQGNPPSCRATLIVTPSDCGCSSLKSGWVERGVPGDAGDRGKGEGAPAGVSRRGSQRLGFHGRAAQQRTTCAGLLTPPQQALFRRPAWQGLAI